MNRRKSRVKKRKMLLLGVSILLFISTVMLELILYPSARKRVLDTFSGQERLFLVFQLLLPVLRSILMGIIVILLLSCLIRLEPDGKWKTLIVSAGTLFLLPSIIVFFDVVMRIAYPDHQPQMFYLLYLRTSSFPSLQFLIFTFLPMMSGMCLPFIFNNE